MAYSKGMTGRLAIYVVKKYRGHRTIPDSWRTALTADIKTLSMRTFQTVWCHCPSPLRPRIRRSVATWPIISCYAFFPLSRQNGVYKFLSKVLVSSGRKHLRGVAIFGVQDPRSCHQSACGKRMQGKEQSFLALPLPSYL